jgi:hypothetical protein
MDALPDGGPVMPDSLTKAQRGKLLSDADRKMIEDMPFEKILAIHDFIHELLLKHTGTHVRDEAAARGPRSNVSEGGAMADRAAHLDTILRAYWPARVKDHATRAMFDVYPDQMLSDMAASVTRRLSRPGRRPADPARAAERALLLDEGLAMIDEANERIAKRESTDG